MNKNKTKEEQAGKAKKIDDLTKLNGYVDLTVHYKTAEAFDDEELKELEKLKELFGKTEQVKARAARAKKIPQYHLLLFGNNDEALAEFICRKEPGWGALLDNESLLLVLENGQALNESFWKSWFRMTTTRNEAVMPGSTNIVAKALEAAIAAQKAGQSRSPIGSPKESAMPP